MDEYSTFVFRHADEGEARRFCSEIMKLYPFGGAGPTCMTACAVGDAMSTSEAVIGALECTALHDTERHEFVGEIAACNNWDDCMKLAEKWELRWEQGAFVDARKIEEVA
jgi:hypothetical protein